MAKYHAVMIDETGCEFGVTVEAPNKDEAWDQVSEDYPESRCESMLSQDEQEQRRRDIEAYAQRMYDDPAYDIY